jgi:predicted membrane metal-binding protein
VNEKDDRGLVLAIGGISLAWLVFFAAQIRILSLETAIFEEQHKALTQQVESAKTTEVHTDEALQKRESQIRKSQASEIRYTNFFNDLIELSKVDPDARVLVLKWKIQSNPTANPPPQTQPSAADVPPPKRP